MTVQEYLASKTGFAAETIKDVHVRPIQGYVWSEATMDDWNCHFTFTVDGVEHKHSLWTDRDIVEFMASLT